MIFSGLNDHRSLFSAYPSIRVSPLNIRCCFLLLACAFLFLPPSAFGATYYIDYQSGSDSNGGLSRTTPWKRSPGMNGFAGIYSHSAGDIFVFKGGVTWPSSTMPLTIAYSGAEGSPDQYTVDHAWYRGGSWDYPTFDGENVPDAYQNGMIYGGYGVNLASHIVVDHLKVINVGNLLDGSGMAIALSGNDIEVKYCWIEPNSVNGFASDCAGGVGKLYFHHNMMRKAGRLHISCIDNRFDDVRIYSNIFPGAYDYDSHSFHTDGVMIGADGVGTWKATNLRIYNNKWYGNWSRGATAEIYLNGSPAHYGFQQIYIYNNVLVTENTGGYSMSPAFISIAFGHDNIHIYNNTIDGRSNPIAGQGIAFSYNNSNINIRNNIIAGVDNAIAFDSLTGGTVTADYNLFYTVDNNHLLMDARVGKRYNTCTELQAAGFGTNFCLQADPKFVALPSSGIEGSGDWRLNPDSPAADKGLALSAYFMDDLNGDIRAGGKWDLGAYNKLLSRFFPPMNLRIIR